MSIVSRDLARVLGSTALSLSLATGISFVAISHGIAADDPLVPPITVAPNGNLELPDGQVVNYIGGGSGVSAITVSTGGILTGTDAVISTNGVGPASHSLAAGIRAGANSIVELTGGSVNATGSQHTRGILGSSGARIATIGTDISTAGDNSHGVHVETNATASIQGGIISTQGNDSFALYSQKGSNLTAYDVTIETGGVDGFGVFTYGNESFLELIGGAITTTGERGHGAVAGENTSIKLTGTTIDTSGNKALGIVADQANTSVIATDVNIITRSDNHAYGVYAKAAGPETADISLIGGSITTASAKGQGTQDGDGSRGYAILSEGAGASVSATGTTIHTVGQRAYGAYAIGGGTVALNDLAITTEGFMAYGVYASGAGSVLNAENVDITTSGEVGDAAWAYAGGTLNLNGGTYIIQGEQNTNTPHELANGLVAVGGTSTTAGGLINARNLTIATHGANSYGFRAGTVVGLDQTYGIININDSAIVVTGENSHAGQVQYGSTLTINNSVLVSEKGNGIQLTDNANVTLNGTTIAAAQETFVSSLNKAGQTQNIKLGKGTVATQNNGTLLSVNRTENGADGVVQLTLGTGSTTQGNIVDEDARATGGTDVTLEEGASWAGKLSGVRNFFGFQGGSVDFEGEANVAGNLNGTGTSYSFSSQGGTIGGNVNLADGSSTTGGSIDNRIVVGGDVNVDDTSILGGNWSIGRNLTISGILSPGNSIGRVDVDGNVDLFTSSVYEVDVDQSGDADLITVNGTANLDGTVVVTAMDGYKLASPYTILTAGTIDGEFQSASLAQPSAFLDANLAHGANDVTLTIDRNATSFESVADTSNQAAVAGALDRMALSNPVVAAIALSSSTEARDAFQQLSGDTNASVKTGLIETANLTADAINNRLRSAFDGVGAANMPVLSFAQSSNSAAGSAIDDASASPSYNYAFWATGFGSWIDHDGNANAGGMKTSTGGFLSGLDIGLNSGWRLGVVGGYSETNLDAKGRNASATSDNWHLGVYGGNQWGALGVRAGLIHTWHSVDSSRSTSYAGFGDSLAADYDARTLQAFGEIGYRIDVAPVALEPFANLSHVRLRTDGFTEKGGSSALAVESETTNTTFTTLGVRASTPFQLGATTANLNGTIGWRHAYGDITPESTQAFIGGNAFTVQGAPIAKDAALLEAGFDVAITKTSTFGVNYVGQFGNGTTQNGFNASFNVKF
ncbi:autotransporter domain-containing protein [Ochrobactrum sp. S1502_03]|uniref:autotransporter domain-containing protein n=1 Tax=Ochrobactrum sp. S1502_03 TaxID=3108451 RepID=UPI0037CA8AE8